MKISKNMKIVALVLLAYFLLVPGSLMSIRMAMYDSEETGMTFSPLENAQGDIAYVTPDSVVRGDVLRVCVQSIDKVGTFDSSIGYKPGLVIVFDDTVLNLDNWYPGMRHDVPSYIYDWTCDDSLQGAIGVGGIHRESYSYTQAHASVCHDIDTTDLVPGWHVIKAYYPISNIQGMCSNIAAYPDVLNFIQMTDAPMAAWKKVYIVPQDCSIGDNEMLVTQEFGSGHTITKSGLRWPVSRWCDTAPPIVLRSDTNRVEQGYEILTALDSVGSYEVPPSRIVSISYITTTPEDVAKVCRADETYYADIDSCGLPGMLHYCGGGGTFDPESGTCTVQSFFNCPSGTFWSDIAGQCVKSVCPGGSYWSTKLKTCLKPVGADLCGDGDYDLSTGMCVLTATYHECVLDPAEAEPWELDSLPHTLNRGCDVIGCPPEYDCIAFDTGITESMCIGLGAETDDIHVGSSGIPTSCYYPTLEPVLDIVCPTDYTLNPQKTACIFKPPTTIVCPDDSEWDAGYAACVREPGLLVKCPVGYSYEPAPIDKCLIFPSLKEECPPDTYFEEAQGVCIYLPEVAVRCMWDGVPDPLGRYDSVLDKCVRTVSTSVECDMPGAVMTQTESGAYSCTYTPVTDIVCPLGGEYNAELNRCIIYAETGTEIDCGNLYYDEVLDACLYTPKTIAQCPSGYTLGVDDQCYQDVAPFIDAETGVFDAPPFDDAADVVIGDSIGKNALPIVLLLGGGLAYFMFFKKKKFSFKRWFR